MESVSKRIQFIFWTHFLVALAGHVVFPVMFMATVYLIFTWHQGIIVTLLLLGLAYCALVWGVNHVTNPKSYCYLTDLEQHYRKEAGVTLNSDAFLPRFYKKCKQILQKNFKEIPEE